MSTTRRAFGKQLGLIASLFAPAAAFANHTWWSTYLDGDRPSSLGPLVRDPKHVLDLPSGHSYKVLAQAGTLMSDKMYVPMDSAAIGVLDVGDGEYLLINNHRLCPGNVSRTGPFGFKYNLYTDEVRSKLYDGGSSGKPSQGSTTLLRYDRTSGTVRQQHLAQSGLLCSASGVVTPWSTWLSAEKIVQDQNERYAEKHGFVFEMNPLDNTGLAKPRKLPELGRFRHEAIVVSPEGSIVYQTEDEEDGLFYRFIPSEFGVLDSGRLQALVGTIPEDRKDSDSGSVEVQWVDVPSPSITDGDDSLRSRARALGAWTSGRGRGMCLTANGICFLTGTHDHAQLWQYRPTGADSGTLSRHREFSASEFDDWRLLSSGPNDSLVLASRTGTEHYLHLLTREGALVPIARNVATESHFSGVAFSPDHKTLFANTQLGGRTFAIYGEWSGT